MAKNNLNLDQGNCNLFISMQVLNYFHDEEDRVALIRGAWFELWMLNLLSKLDANYWQFGVR